MSPLLLLLTLAVYGVAGYLFWRERSVCYLLTLIGGHLAMLLMPLWERAYQLAPADGAGLVLADGVAIAWPVLIYGGVLLVLPALLFYYGLRHRWWPRHYAVLWTGYAVAVLYFAVVDAGLERGNQGLIGLSHLAAAAIVPPTLTQAMLLAGVSLFVLYAMISTRHYGLQMALVPLLLAAIVGSLLFLGILGGPLWVAGLLAQQGVLDERGWLISLATLISLLLVLWGVHLLAAGLHSGRRQHLVWR
ncbi:hypothetical protein [Kallotenue papyrolyticum]|uniref:hypothetical protein n=1 Tax=Kallotenue papyrolyticum TaxID=1325125 RepID=UPI00049251E9|nr:hypothetical protein [Kallotenue papyrolyticum]